VRIAALFLGLMAGLFALLAPSPFRTDLLPQFLEMWSATSSERLLGVIVWYAIPGAALLGGLLATVMPGFAALLLLAAATGWLGIGASMPQHFDYQLVAPAAAAALGALFAFIAGELGLRRRREARRNRRAAAEAVTDDGEFEREAALRMDPMLMPRDEARSPLPRRPIPLTLDDVTVTSRPSSPPPRWQDIDAPKPHREADEWAGVQFTATPPRDEPQPRAEPPTVARTEESWPQPQMQPATPAASETPRRGNGMVAAVAAVAAVLGIGVLLAGGYLLYRDGMLDNLIGATRAPAVATAGETPAEATRPELTLPKTAEAASATPAASPSSAAEPSRVAASPQPESYDDPFKYCRAVDTIDYVDRRYGGPAFTEAIASALDIPPDSARDRVRWRCYEGSVLACSSYVGPVCDMAPTVGEMQAFCKSNPDVAQLTAPSGTWSCVAGTPNLPPDAKWPIDERGFLPDSWVVVPDIGVTPAG
jgi:hypothetical protein